MKPRPRRTTIGPVALTKKRVDSLLQMVDLGLTVAEQQVRDALAHDQTMAGMHAASELDRTRGAAIEAAVILRARYLGTADEPALTDTPLPIKLDTIHDTKKENADD